MGRQKKNSSQAPPGQPSICTFFTPKSAATSSNSQPQSSMQANSAPGPSHADQQVHPTTSAPSPMHAASQQPKRMQPNTFMKVLAVTSCNLSVKEGGKVCHASTRAPHTVAQRCISNKEDDEYELLQLEKDSSVITADAEEGPSHGDHTSRTLHTSAAPSFLPRPSAPPLVPAHHLPPNLSTSSLVDPRLVRMEESRRQLEAIQASLRSAPEPRLNDEQRVAASSSGSMPLLILAGAGTGKTTTLMARTRHLILRENVKPRSIQLITFTNKAAEEMKERLALAMPCLIRPPLSPEDKPRPLINATTFHAYCLRILLSYHQEAGFEKRPVVWADAEVKEAVIIAMRRAELDMAAATVMEWMGLASPDWNDVLKAVKERHADLFNLAASYASTESKKRADEGKRKKGKEAEDGGNQPKKKSRSSKASTSAANLSSRAQFGQHFKLTKAPAPLASGSGALPSSPSQSKPASFLSPFQPDEESIDVGMPSSSTRQPSNQLPPLPPRSSNQAAATAAGNSDEVDIEIVGQVHKVEFLFKLFQLLETHYKPPPAPPAPPSAAQAQQVNQPQAAQKRKVKVRLVGDKPDRKSVKERIGWLDLQKRNGRTSLDFVGSYQRFYHHYQSLLKQCSAVDFNDLLIKVRDIMLSSRGDPRGVLSRLRARHTHLLVDEFQDCNPIQIELINLLQEGRNQLTVVGDDAQGIYRFRGASAGTFKNFEKGFEESEPPVRFSRPQIVQNHRSRPKIIKLANHLLIGAGSIPKDLIATKEEGDQDRPIDYIEAGTPDDKAEVIVAKIKERRGEGVEYDQMAVLFRAFNNPSGKTHKRLEDALSKGGIPFHVVRTVAFLLRVDVAITLSYLRLALNPDDSVAFSSVMNKPPRGLPLAVEDALKKVQEDQAMGLDRGTMGGKSLMEIARSVVDPKAGGSKGGLSDTHIKKLSIFINLMDRLADDVSGMSPSESISHILNITGYAAWLKAALDRKKKREKGDEEEESEGGAGPSTSGAAAAKEKGRPSSSEKSQVAEDEEEVEEDEGEEEGEEKEKEKELGEGEEDDSGLEDDQEAEEGTEAPSHLAPFPHLKYLFYAAQGFQRDVWLPPPALFSSHRSADEGEGGEEAERHIDSLLMMSCQCAKAHFSPREMRVNAGLPEELISLMYAPEGKGRWCIREFLSHITLLGAGDDTTEDALSSLATGSKSKKPVKREIGVTISTIHAAKGLEWDTVFVAHYVDGILPMVPRDDDAGEVGLTSAARAALGKDKERESRLHFEEEKRLAHVAVTRAKERLFVTSYRFETRRGSAYHGDPRCPSRFSLLKDEPDWLYDASPGSGKGGGSTREKEREKRAVVRMTIMERSSLEKEKGCDVATRNLLLGRFEVMMEGDG